MDCQITIKKIMVVVVLSFIIALTIFSVPSSASAVQLSDAEKRWLTGKDEIVFVSQTRYPPFEFIDKENNREGMCIELVRWIATEFGFKTRFRDMSFQRAQQEILTGQADVLTSLFYSTLRDAKFDFTQKTWEVPALIFVASERPDITGVRDLEGKRIAMQRGDYAAEFLQDQKVEYKLLPTATFAEAVDAVIAGNADAVIGDKQIVLYHLYSNQLTDRIKSVGQPLYTGQNCMGVREGATELQSILNKGIQLAHDRGIFSTITQKWTGVHYSPIAPWYYRHLPYLLAATLGLLILFCCFLLWNAQLRRQVSWKTKEIHSREVFLNSVVENIPNMIFVKDAKELRFVRLNQAGVDLLGYSKKELLGKNDYDFFPKEQADFFTSKDCEVLRSGTLYDIPEDKIYTKEKGTRLLHTKKITIFDESQEPLYLLGISEDITDLKSSEAKLREYADTQSTLFHEVNHRVKNNLMAIISMLHQEEDRAAMEGKQEYIARLNEVLGRVQGLFTVHSLLSSTHWHPLSLSLLCEKVIEGSMKILASDLPVSVDIPPSDLSVDSDQAHYLALVINELATNTLKYAPQATGTIQINVSVQKKNSVIELFYRDNGPGYPEDLLCGIIPSTCIGYNLITGIVKKSLQGDILFANNNGATVTVTVPHTVSKINQ